MLEKKWTFNIHKRNLQSRYNLKSCCVAKMHSILCVLGLAFVASIKGGNILRDKYTTNTLSPTYTSDKAVDGSLTSGHTNYVNRWQADLLGYYRITNISVTRNTDSDAALGLGVTTLFLGCPDMTLVNCGWWPAMSDEPTKTFTCPIETPVRFILLFDASFLLRLIEVEATGVLAQPSVLQYDLEPTGRKYTVTWKTLTVTIVNECAAACFFIPSCTGFSFLEGASDNCLIGTSCEHVADDPDWKMYKIDPQPSFCNE